MFYWIYIEGYKIEDILFYGITHKIKKNEQTIQIQKRKFRCKR